jgi:metallo-beta-lactamase class B
MLARTLLLLMTVAGTFVAPVTAQMNSTWTTNHPPFRVAGNLYYVGSDDLAAYLVTTPQGNILINANLTSSVPQIRQNIEKLGFRFADTKILLNGQAHFDHVAGTAEIKRLTHAKVEVMEGDVIPMESGGRKDFFFYNDPSAYFPPAKVDKVLHDGEQVSLGGTVLTAHLTPGHTKGCTTWTMQVTDEGKTYNVVIVGGASMNGGNNLIHDPRYPTEADDFLRTFQILRGLPCDLFLGAHGVYFDLKAKYPKLQAGAANPFLDPNGYKAFINDREQVFRKELARQTALHK